MMSVICGHVESMIMKISEKGFVVTSAFFQLWQKDSFSIFHCKVSIKLCSKGEQFTRLNKGIL